MSAPTAWLIWSHERGQWWRPNRFGYTPDKSDAGRYTLAEALAILAGANHDGDAPPNESLVPAP